MAQNSQFAFVTFEQAKQSLALRLNDTSNLHWTDTENGLYIQEALRLWNCLTQQWVQDWTTTYDDTALAWQSTANSLNSLVGANPTSPRYQTLTDAYIYTMAQYHLLETPTGNGTWTGTTQFTLADFSGALQEYRDTILQAAACNMGPFSNSFSVTPGTNKVQLPDSTTQSILDVRRVRYLPTTGDPVTLFREDGLSMEYFNNAYMQTSGTPLGWDVLAGPPQFLTFDSLVNQPNTLDILAMISGGIITPPTASPLLIPDDFYWVLKFGMMSDMLSKESESTDHGRSDYCEQRYQEGLKIMMQMPWILQARIDEDPVDTPSIFDMDNFEHEWQSIADAQQAIVLGGTDLFAVSPTIPTDSTVSVTLSLVGNAPMPASDSSYLQVSRDILTVILDEAQHLAAFKHGGKEFTDTLPLHQNLIQMALTTNRRLRESGIFASTLRPPVSKIDQSEPRMALEE